MANVQNLIVNTYHLSLLKRQIQFWSSHTSFSSWSFPTTRKEVKRIIRSRDNRRIRLKCLRGHLPHIWTFTSRAWIVKAWTNGRENRRLSMRNIFQFDVQVNVNEYNLRNEKNWALSYVWQDCIHALYSSKYQASEPRQKLVVFEINLVHTYAIPLSRTSWLLFTTINHQVHLRASPGVYLPPRFLAAG